MIKVIDWKTCWWCKPLTACRVSTHRITAAVAHTCRFKCCFFNRFFGNMVLSRDCTHARYENPRKHHTFTMLLLKMQKQLWCRLGRDQHKLLSFIIFQNKKWDFIYKNAISKKCLNVVKSEFSSKTSFRCCFSN